MSAEIAELVQQAGPYLTAALSAYGRAVLTPAEDAAEDTAEDGTADATAALGRRILRAVRRRRAAPEQAGLEAAVLDAAEDPDDAEAAAALRQQLKRALRGDADLRRELADLLPAPAAGTVTIAASGPRSVAAHTIGTAITGDVTALPPEILHAARDIQAPRALTNLAPFPLLLGREDALAWLRDTLTEQSGTATARASTVHGLGGVGKSTLALAYAHRYRHTYSLIWWINADSPTRIEQSLAGLASRLHPVGAGGASQTERAEWAMTWLQWHPGWLLIFDNVENPADSDRYLGALDGGHHILTSRRTTGWPRTIPTYPLGTLDADEAADLICTYALTDGITTPRERQDARALASDLGHLPLALQQAGAYLGQNPTISIADYRGRLTAKLDKTADDTVSERTIARIWTQTLQALTDRNPRAVELLHTFAWLAPDNIPISLLAIPGADDDSLHEALGLLAAYSMATVTRHTAGVHRLLQTVLRATAPADPQGLPAGRREAELALVRVLTALDIGSSPEWDELLPHLITIAATTPHGHTKDPAAPLYEIAARYLYHQGHDVRAIPLRAAGLTQYEQTLGHTHPDTLMSRNGLANAYRAAGDLDRAIPLYETTLAQYEQALGDTHPHTLTCRNGLANTYRAAGYLGRAIPLYETTLAQRGEVLGDTHPDTLMSRNGLANAYRAAGYLGRAIPLYEATLAQYEQALGDTHPHTLTCRNGLAKAYRAAGYLGRAIPLFETALAQRGEVLGETHRDTLMSRTELARAYRSAGDLKRAIPLFEATLAQYEQALSNAHRDTLSCRNSLANAYRAAGDLDRAIPLYETTVAQFEQVLGETHRDTLSCRNDLANAYRAAGHLDRAIPLYETTLAQFEQVLGETHRDTLSCRNDLVWARRAAEEGP
ncbi:FxSxx-COOH system tetratricopeptide repeat protein [Kitasatospora sp. NPDC058170]|uniref:FxSxx-COOH system tetratricopeptide repeat protein n=1 Tax=Kitasatospora sp. NPDC058170 TaxID=3346364 RepID=UPI0036DD8097